MEPAKELLDADMTDRDRYRTRLPRWRYRLRERMLPVVRGEAPYLAWLQQTMRSPTLDSYFAITANLGTHTFFLIMLPILFWCGQVKIGRGMVHVLAFGVVGSSLIKDLCCLPRPTSPPLRRITMSTSAGREYGFPSTHSTNAVSIVVYATHLLRTNPFVSPKVNASLQLTFYLYALTIILGRLYCGMHGFLDVTIGGLLGAIISLVQCAYGNVFDEYIHGAGLTDVLVIVFCILMLIRIHPEPVDDCPCFEDSVAFAGVIIGVEYGSWHLSKNDHAHSSTLMGTILSDFDSMACAFVTARIIVGVVVIFLWREITKPSMFRVLPPIFSGIEMLGVILPGKSFKQASEYTSSPQIGRDENVITAASNASPVLTLVRDPRRRVVSSAQPCEVNACEPLTDQANRQSPEDPVGHVPDPICLGDSGPPQRYQRLVGIADRVGHQPAAKLSQLQMYNNVMGEDFDHGTCESDRLSLNPVPPVRSELHRPQKKEGEFPSSTERVAVRHDVEVITKLIVYCGIGWLAVEGNPILFEVLGLGL